MLKFSLIPKILTHLRPITSNDNIKFYLYFMSKHKFFRVAPPSAVCRILSVFNENATLTDMFDNPRLIHLCKVCRAAFMHRNSFLFHLGITALKLTALKLTVSSQGFGVQVKTSYTHSFYVEAAATHYHSCYANSNWTSFSDFCNVLLS